MIKCRTYTFIFWHLGGPENPVNARPSLIAIGLVVFEIFKFENVDARTDGRTDGRRLDYYTISSPSAQVS